MGGLLLRRLIWDGRPCNRASIHLDTPTCWGGEGQWSCQSLLRQAGGGITYRPTWASEPGLGSPQQLSVITTASL